MNNPRVLLWLALAAILVLNYQTWMHDYGAPEPGAATHAAPAGEARTPGGVLDTAVPQTFSTDSTGPPKTAAGAAPAAAAAPSAEPAGHAAPAAPHVHVRTDVLDMDISLTGGTLQRADLLRYPKVKGGSEPVRLMNEDSEESWYVLKTGLAGPGEAYPTQFATLTSPTLDYELGSAPELSVPLSWTDGH